MTRICIAGATGRIGRSLVSAISGLDDGLRLVGAVSRKQQGQNLGSLLRNDNLNLPIHGSVKEALEAATADVLIDYTDASVATAHALEAIRRRTHVVLGTTGLAAHDYDVIDAAAREYGVGVVAASNFAITLAVLQLCALLAAEFIADHEIIDYASRQTTVAPLSTTKDIAERLAECPTTPLFGETMKDPTGAKIHSVRVAGYVSDVEVVFGEPNERLALRHSCSNEWPYVRGTLLAARTVNSCIGVVRGLDKLLLRLSQKEPSMPFSGRAT